MVDFSSRPPAPFAEQSSAAPSGGKSALPQAAGRGSRGTRNWRDHLTQWEELQVECLASARDHLAGECEATAALFGVRLNKIRNRASHRARYAAGYRQAR